MLVLTHNDVTSVLENREREVIDAVADAYRAHHQGSTALPHSVFLRLPRQPRNRIIGLPGYLSDGSPVAGLKWVASFPANLERGRPRASALMILNDPDTGRPEAVLEAGTISARRTGASAALVVGLLPGASPDSGATLIGCGVINYEILRFLRLTLPTLGEVALYDLDADRARAFATRCQAEWPELAVNIDEGYSIAVARHRLVSIATTATAPYTDLSASQPGSLILHVSLRDITIEAILRGDNVVDDVEHVCREQTSVHLAAQRAGHRLFINGTVGDLLAAGQVKPRAPDRLTIFSPFGLGVLDLAVARLVWSHAVKNGLGTAIPGFLP